MDWTFFWQWIANISGVIGIVAIFPIVYTAWRIHTRKNRLYGILAGKGGKSGKDGILIVDISDLPEMSPQVMAFCAQDATLKNVAKECVGIVNYGLIGADYEKDIENIFAMFNKEHKRLLDGNVGHIHFFFRGPAMVGAMIGARLSNCSVSCYQYDRVADKYINWGTVRRHIVK